jgi:hypothetical protein
MIESDRNSDHGKPNDIDNGWRKLEHKKFTAATARERKTPSTEINETEGEGGTLRQVGFIDLRFMFQTHKDNNVFHLTRALNNFWQQAKPSIKTLALSRFAETVRIYVSRRTLRTPRPIV